MHWLDEALDQLFAGRTSDDVLQSLVEADESKWVQKVAKKNKGKLHRKLGIPEGKKIPQEVLDSAYAKAKKDGDTETMREINFAKNAGRFSHKK